MGKKYFWKGLLFFAVIIFLRAAIATEPVSATAASNTEEPAATALPTPVVDGKFEKFTDGDAVWTYNQETKCLVISGKGKISVYGRDESMGDIDPDWYPWDAYHKHCYRPNYAGEVKKIVIEPGITSINAGAFHEYQSLKTVEIADTVTTLEEYAFFRCKALKNVSLGNGIREISEGTFFGCSTLPEFTIGKNVEKIGKEAFFYCLALKELKLDPENTNLLLESGILYDRQKTILYFCPVGIKSVKIPKSVQNIAAGAFSYCKKLKKISFAKGSKCTWIGQDAFYGCEKLQGMLFPDSVQFVGENSFYDCKSIQRISLGSSFVGFTWEDSLKKAKKHYQVPSQSIFVKDFSHGKIKKYQVSKSNPRYSSRDGVLYNKDKTKLLCYPQEKKNKTVKILNSVQVIQKDAFQYNRYIKQVIMPQSLKKIGSDAFGFCTKLKTVTIRGNQVVIGSYAFRGCRALSKVDLGNSVREIKKVAFYSTKIKEIYIPASVTKIGKDALGKGSDSKRLPGGTMSYTERDVTGFKIYGKKGSAAERYAKKNGLVFIAR